MRPALVVVGASRGGLTALSTLLGALPASFATPLAVVQHRGAHTAGLERSLAAACALPLVEPEDREPIAPGHVYLAPADYHLLVEQGRFRLSTEAPVNHSRPAIDPLFESAADEYGRALIAVVLTGASRDGAQGARRVKERGGSVMVQDPDSAEDPVMPAAAIAAAAVDRVLALEDIAPCLIERCHEAKG